MNRYSSLVNEIVEFSFMIDDLKTTSSKNDKVKIIKSSYERFPEIAEILKYAYDPMITFGIKNKIEVRDDFDENKVYFIPDWTNVKESLDMLKDRKITGNEAVNYAQRLCNLCKWTTCISKIFKKDLDCGISVKTINKAIPNCIKEFNISLCEVVDIDNISSDRWWIAQEKLDGVRNIAIVYPEKKTVIHYSRTGKEVTPFKDIFDTDLLSIVDKHFSNVPMVFDGEVKGSTWNQTMNAKATVNENIEAKNNLAYYIFSFMTLEQFINKTPDKSESDILNTIVKILDGYGTVKLPKTCRCNTKSDINTFYNDVIGCGGEGIVLKNPESIYNFKKSKNWLKLKPKDTYDGIIKEVKSHSKDSNQLGAVFVEGEYDNKPFTVWVGSGFTEEQRIDWWKNKDNLIGKTIEIEANEFIVGDDKCSLRFPRCKCIRLDK